MGRNAQKGQNAIEYLLVLTIVILAVIWLARPRGFLWNEINQSIHISLNMVNEIAENVTF